MSTYLIDYNKIILDQILIQSPKIISQNIHHSAEELQKQDFHKH